VGNFSTIGINYSFFVHWLGLVGLGFRIMVIRRLPVPYNAIYQPKLGLRLGYREYVITQRYGKISSRHVF